MTLAYTIQDIADELGVKASTIRAYLSRGQMPAPRDHIGRTPYWTPADIEPWIEQQRTNRRHPRNPQPSTKVEASTN